jgi:hypothetical protein
VKTGAWLISIMNLLSISEQLTAGDLVRSKHNSNFIYKVLDKYTVECYYYTRNKDERFTKYNRGSRFNVSHNEPIFQRVIIVKI